MKPHDRIRELADKFDARKHYPGEFLQGLLREVANVLEAEAEQMETHPVTPPKPGGDGAAIGGA